MNFDFCTLPDCKNSGALGMENGNISDGQITVSSKLWADVPASNGRLNFPGSGSNPGAWLPAKTDLNPWLQVDFQRSTIVTGISTQGRSDYNQFVKKYSISFSDDEVTFNFFKVDNIVEVR